MPRVEDENDPSLIKPEFSKVYRDERHNMDNCVVRIVRDLGYWLECSLSSIASNPSPPHITVHRPITTMASKL